VQVALALSPIYQGSLLNRYEGSAKSDWILPFSEGFISGEKDAA
jgi:hypothetical protein